MSKLEELIKEYCPDGVEYRILSDVAAYQKQRIDASMVNENNYVGVDNLLQDKAGKTKAASVPSTGSIIRYEQGDILIGNIRPYLRKIWLADCDGGTNGDVLAVHIKCDGVESKYLFYVLSSDNFFYYDVNNSKGAKMPRGDKKAVMKYRFPIPPLEVQREIVRILDNYSAVVAEIKSRLADELTARKKQYEHYANTLLSFPNSPCYSLEELCDYVDYRGKTPKKSNDGVFLVTAKNIRQGYIDYEKSQEYIPSETYETVMRRGLPKIGDVLITTEAPCGNVAQVDREGIALAQRVIKYRPKNDRLDRTFLKYILLSNEFQEKILRAATGGTVKGIKGSRLHKLTIPVPPLEEQKRVVEILNKFDGYCNSITTGLPAEIEARQKQYEYYRDKLLSFKEKEQ